MASQLFSFLHIALQLSWNFVVAIVVVYDQIVVV